MRLKLSKHTLFRYAFVEDPGQEGQACKHGQMKFQPQQLWEDTYRNLYKLLMHFDGPEVELTSDLHTEGHHLCINEEGYGFMAPVRFVVLPEKT